MQPKYNPDCLRIDGFGVARYVQPKDEKPFNKFQLGEIISRSSGVEFDPSGFIEGITHRTYTFTKKRENHLRSYMRIGGYHGL